MSCPRATNTIIICMRVYQLQRTNDHGYFWIPPVLKQINGQTNLTRNRPINTVALFLLSHLWKQASATSRANLNRLGRKPVLDLVSAPLKHRLKVICQESLVQSRRNKFLFPYNISSKKFQSQGIDRSQLLASSNKINCQVHIKLWHPFQSCYGLSFCAKNWPQVGKSPILLNLACPHINGGDDIQLLQKVFLFLHPSRNTSRCSKLIVILFCEVEMSMLQRRMAWLFFF